MTLTCTKSKLKTPEQYMKFVQKYKHKNKKTWERCQLRHSCAFFIHSEQISNTLLCFVCTVNFEQINAVAVRELLPEESPRPILSDQIPHSEFPPVKCPPGEFLT